MNSFSTQLLPFPPNKLKNHNKSYLFLESLEDFLGVYPFHS